MKEEKNEPIDLVFFRTVTGGDQGFGARLLRQPRHQNAGTHCRGGVGFDTDFQSAAGASFGPRRLGAVDWFGGAGQCTLAVAGFVASRQLHPATGLVAFCFSGGVGHRLAHGLVGVCITSAAMAGDAPRCLATHWLDGHYFVLVCVDLFRRTLAQRPSAQSLFEAVTTSRWA
jgi:hypothetical protein